MVFRVYVEKKRGLELEAAALKEELTVTLGLSSVEGVRVINRYDAENITEELFREAVRTVFSEPQLDDVFRSLPEGAGETFAVEYLPGQFDQRADSAAQCIQILSCGERPVIRTARVYVISGRISADDMAKIKKFLINPVESREASLELPSTLVTEYTRPADVAVLDGFRKLS
ncbi:MAG: phosphoribosylformylglycinamidine synthase, partial [Clostridia bacterium]|nr:phosphoribosylformylglycinamidine synthase [Clostridia bacterium]